MRVFDDESDQRSVVSAGMGPSFTGMTSVNGGLVWGKSGPGDGALSAAGDMGKVGDGRSTSSVSSLGSGSSVSSGEFRTGSGSGFWFRAGAACGRLSE